VQIVPEGGTILDPFAGSATTGVAAKLEKRNFIGFELSKEYFEIGKQRLQGKL
jgi:site-specific DNA-methyltransferase (adenine-specific)